MSVRIRLKKFGTKARPYYRVVVMDSRAPRDGRALDYVGTYQPIEADGKQVALEADKIKDWLKKGALPSETVHGLLNKQGIHIK